MSARALQLAGVAAAVVLAVVVNVLAARHFWRWDWTESRRWSVSPATLTTLAGLDRPVDVWVVAGRGDPAESSLRQLVGAYTAATPHLDVHWIDPDRDAAQLVDLQARFGLEAGQTEDGRVATDATVIVASGSRHWFLTHDDLFAPADDVHVKPREERALTQAIRQVLGGEKARLCFTVGHGELSLDDPREGTALEGRDSLGAVRALLEKGNYDLAAIDAAGPDAHEPFAGCAAVVLAGPRDAFSRDEANRLRSYLLQGGSLLAAVGAPDDVDGAGAAGSSFGLDEVLAPFGVGLDDGVVHDVDAEVAIPETHGEGFFVTPHPHPVTASLVPGGADAHPPRVATFLARPLRHVAAPGAAPAADLLVTSGGAFAKASLAGAAAWSGAPPRDPGDKGGPFVVAMASERPAPGAHGARVVVVGSRYALAEENWRQPRTLHGAAFFVDSALSWLTARPEVVDVPDRAEVAVAMRLSDEARAEVRRYVLVLMPLAVVLLGLAVWAWRRSSENAPHVPHAPAKREGGAS
jgi:hypothetical protein